MQLVNLYWTKVFLVLKKLIELHNTSRKFFINHSTCHICFSKYTLLLSKPRKLAQKTEDSVCKFWKKLTKPCHVVRGPHTKAHHTGSRAEVKSRTVHGENILTGPPYVCVCVCVCVCVSESVGLCVCPCVYCWFTDRTMVDLCIVSTSSSSPPPSFPSLHSPLRLVCLMPASFFNSWFFISQKPLSINLKVAHQCPCIKHKKRQGWKFLGIAHLILKFYRCSER